MTIKSIDWQKVEFISFDLDDTLWPNAEVIRNANVAMLSKLHEMVPITKKLLPSTQLKQWHKQFFMTVTGIDYDLNQKRKQAIANYLRSINISDSNDVIAEQVFDAFYQTRQQVKLYDDALPALEQLSKRFRLVSLTNGNANMSQIEGHHFFDAHFTAAGLKVAKPDPEIYSQLLKALNCSASRLAHIGDSLTMDVAPAQSLGIASIWLNRESDELDESASHLVQPQLTVKDLIQLANIIAPQ
jgi:FMN hydrolase / 5-amino-6-(5-phospho-D-ribitylamino)uracil phosphatase